MYYMIFKILYYISLYYVISYHIVWENIAQKIPNLQLAEAPFWALMCGAQWAFRTPVQAIDLDVKYQCLQIQLWFRAPNSWFGAYFHPRLLLGGLWDTSRYLQMTRKRNINSLKVKNNLHHYGEAISSCQVALYKCNGLKIRVPQIVAMDLFGRKEFGKTQTPESPECFFVRNL